MILRERNGSVVQWRIAMYYEVSYAFAEEGSNQAVESVTRGVPGLV